MKETDTLWILLDVSNSMRGAAIESARNVLQQYVLSPLMGSPVRISLITFGDTARLLTEEKPLIADFQVPIDFQVGGLCNLSDAVSLCNSALSSGDKVLILTKGYTTDSSVASKSTLGCECHLLLLETMSSRVPASLMPYFSGKVQFHNMKEASLSELTSSLLI